VVTTFYELVEPLDRIATPMNTRNSLPPYPFGNEPIDISRQIIPVSYRLWIGKAVKLGVYSQINTCRRWHLHRRTIKKYQDAEKDPNAHALQENQRRPSFWDTQSIEIISNFNNNSTNSSYCERQKSLARKHTAPRKGRTNGE
jgi:hypothetical protein